MSQFSQENSNFREPLLLGTLLLICFITSMTSQVQHQIQGGGTAKELLDYMFYLLVKQRHMLLVGAGLLTLRDIVIEAMKCFEQIKVVPQQDNLAETCGKFTVQGFFYKQFMQWGLIYNKLRRGSVSYVGTVIDTGGKLEPPVPMAR